MGKGESKDYIYLDSVPFFPVELKGFKKIVQLPADDCIIMIVPNLRAPLLSILYIIYHLILTF